MKIEYNGKQFTKIKELLAETTISNIDKFTINNKKITLSDFIGLQETENEKDASGSASNSGDWGSASNSGYSGSLQATQVIVVLQATQVIGVLQATQVIVVLQATQVIGVLQATQVIGVLQATQVIGVPQCQIRYLVVFPTK